MSAFGLEQFLHFLAQTGNMWATKLLQHGEAFTPAPKPPTIRWGARQACFHNALRLITTYGDLDYVEGYVTIRQAPVPVHHAWVARPGDDLAIDNTIRRHRTVGRLDPAEYYGIRVPRRILHRAVVETGVGNPWHGVTDTEVGQEWLQSL